MTDPNLDEVRSWLFKARQDLDAASWLLASPHALYGVVGFHSQQTAEKALKAYLTWQEHSFEKTHSFIALVGICLEFDSDFNGLRYAATMLTPFAVTTRYPGDLPDISAQEAKDALDQAQLIWNFVYSRMPVEFRIS